jgi:hypothetical protein
MCPVSDSTLRPGFSVQICFHNVVTVQRMMGMVRIGNLGRGDVLPGNPRVREVEWAAKSISPPNHGQMRFGAELHKVSEGGHMT